MQRRNVAVVLMRPGPDAKPKVLRRFRMVRSAEKFIEQRARRDPAGVHRGDYGIDAPEKGRGS